MRKYHLTLALLLLIGSALTASAQLSGPTSATVNTTHTYQYYSGSWFLGGPGWYVNGGTVMNQWTGGSEWSGYYYYADIKWTSTGSKSVMFANYSESLGTLPVTVCAAPVVPSPLAASSITSSSFTANWSAATGASSYRLDVSTSSSFSTFVSGYNNLPVSSTSRNVTGLAAGTTYYYRVRTVNCTGSTSGNSTSISATTIVDPPGAPSANPATSVTVSSFTANWSASSGATSYRLDVSTSSTFASFVVNNLTVSGTSQSVTGLSSGTTYYYRVRAVNSGGTSGNSNTASVLTGPAVPTANPASTVAETSFTANWSSVTGAASYQLDVSTNSSFSGFVVNNLSVSSTSQSVTGLSGGTTYYYRVRAVNGSGVSGNSNTASVLTLPSSPGLFNASSITATSFIANWTSVTSATGYLLDVSTNISFSSFVAGYNNLSVAGTTQNVTGLSPGTTYYYRVRAVNPSGTSASSATGTVLTLPSAPIANPATSMTTTSFIANWGSVSSATAYALDVSTNNSFSSFVTGYNGLSVTSTNASVTGLVAGTTYYYRVRAVNGSGASGNSNTVIGLTVPAAPAANPATSITTASFTANWAATQGAESYRLDVSTASSFATFVTGYSNLTVSSTSQSVSGLSAGISYYYRVRAVNASGTSSSSAAVSVITLPAAPVANGATSITVNSFTASWNSIASATGYRLDVSTNNTFTAIITGYNNLSVSGTNQSVTGLNAGTTYYYRVRAVNASGNSANSNTGSVLTLPAAPASSTASDITGTSFTANWQSVVSATSYLLDVSSTTDFSSFVSGYQNFSLTATSQNITGLSAGTTYYYRVRAINATGTSAYSSVVLVVGAPVLNPPTSLTTSSFTIGWAAVESATGYQFDVSLSSTFASFVSGYDNLSVSTTSQSVSGLTAGTTYYCRARAVNSNGVSGNSAAVAVITISAAPVANAATALTASGFTANWAVVTGAASYQLDVSTDNIFSSFVTGFNSLSVAGTTANVTGLTSGTTYYYRVRAVNGSGASESSNTVAILTLPAAPATNVATSINSTSFRANWTSVVSATGYRLDVSTSSSFSSFVTGYNNLAITTLDRTVSGLVGGTTYYYRVRAVNASGTSVNSDTRSVLLRPPAPVANAATAITTTSFTANWSTATSATSYRLDVSTVSTFASYLTGYQNLVVSGTSRNVTGLTAGVTYYYRVRAINVSGGSSNSNTRTVSTVPSAPVAKEATNQASTSFTANWQVVTGATGYLLDVSTSSSFATFVTGYSGIAVSATNHNVSGLNSKTAYYYRVRATNSGGTSSYSQTITVSTDNFVPLYNGIITSVRWRTDQPYATTGGGFNGMYRFSYDEKYQVRMASWANPNHTANTFSMDGDKFKVINPDYDPNGNIRKLIRYGANYAITNNFDYTYNEGVVDGQLDNQLDKIDGYADYVYNEIGQLTEELNVSPSDPDQYIEYDVSGKVRKVYSAKTGNTFDDLKVEFIYDDRGFRLAKVDHDPTSPSTTWYIRDARGNLISTYEQVGLPTDANGAPQLNTQDLNQTEVPIYGSGKLGTFYPGQNGSTAYEITDHLGNVRALLRDNSNVFVATMEDTDEADYQNPRVEEMQYFQNLGDTEDENIYMNHTPPGGVAVPNMAALLHWKEGFVGMEASDKGVGPSIALEVRPGDVIDIETWVRFERKETYARDFLLTALSGLLGNTFAGQAGFEAATATQAGSTLEGALVSANYPNDGSNTTVPFAYLNYMILDENLVYKSAQVVRVGDDAGFYPNEMGIMNDHQHLTFGAPINITEKGYIYIWVSNQSEDTKVWFDDLTVEFSGMHLTQATDYGVWGDVIREAKTDESTYRFGYQGQFAENDEETGWNHFELREYDPVIGRWTTIDPMRVGYSPYIGMSNNPINLGDPTGGCPDGKCPDQIVVGDCSCSYVDADGNLITEVSDPSQYFEMLESFHSEFGETYADRFSNGSYWLMVGKSMFGFGFPENPLLTKLEPNGLAGLIGPGGAVKLTSELPVIGNKLSFLFGKATGTAHNIDRSKGMLKQLESIGIFDNAAGNAYLRSHFGEILNTTKGVVQENGRIVRESMLMGPNGGVKMMSVWEEAKLITVELFGR